MLEVKIIVNCQQNKIKLAVMIWFSDYMITRQEKNMLDFKFGTRFQINLAHGHRLVILVFMSLKA
jgi:hypothetical protein